MVISGDGISPFSVKILPDYQVLTNLAIKWKQLSNGNWKASDRGAASDTYDAVFSLHGTEAAIDVFISQVEQNRTAGNNQLAFSSFADTEKIFGEDVDHSGSITATILSMPQKTQSSLNGYDLISISVRAITHIFTGTTTFPTLKFVEVGAMMDADYTIQKADSYTGTFAYSDRRADAGIFDGIFTLSNADFIRLRNNIRITRSGNFTLANTFGVPYPFGYRTSNFYPFTVKLIEWEDLGWFGLKYNRMRLKFAEVI